MAGMTGRTSDCEMRLHLVLALSLLAAPLAAQQRPIAPSPSPLFARPMAVADSGVPHQGISVGAARVIGGLSGLLIGIAAAGPFRSLGPPDGEDGSLDRSITFGLVGMVVGTVIGPLVLSE